MTNGSHSGNASNTFEAFYEGWLVRQEHFLNELLSAQQTINEAGDDNCQTPTFSWKNLWLFTGPGFLMSIVFLDLRNLEGDLQEGAIARNSLLWLLMWATAMRLLVQLLSVRLGVAIEQHLAELCKEEIPCGEGGADCVVEFIGVLTDMQKAAVTCADDWGLGQ